MQKMYVWILLLFISYVRAQQDTCSCFCCTGQSCQINHLGTIYMQSCTYELCLTYCRNSYTECQLGPPNGQVITQCSSTATTLSPLYNCQCACCRTGSPACTPMFVGYSTAYICQSSACSISCAIQYPNQCVSDQTGQTSGTCIGLITTTTTTTTAVATTGSSSPSLGNTCSCLCCQSGPHCSPNIEVGNTTVAQCSPPACTAACQRQYPTVCPSTTYLGYTNGVCTGPISGNTRCRCQCCGINGCPTYDYYTNADCTSCATICPQRCGNTNPVTITCASNRSIKTVQSSSLLFIYFFISYFTVVLYF